MSSVRSAVTDAAEVVPATAADARAARVALIALLLGAAAIGFAPIFVRVSELGPAATAFYRLLFALPALWLWYAIDARRTPASSTARPAGSAMALVIAGLFFAADLAVWHWSIGMTSVANATLFPNFAPVVVTLASFLLFRERFSTLFLGGMAVAIAGAVILLGRSLELGPRHLMGDALALLTAVFYAGYILVVGRLRARNTTAKIMAWSGLVTCAALLPIAIASGDSLLPESAAGWAILVALGLFSHALGQSLIAYALAHLPAAFSSVGLLLQPAVAALLAWALLGEGLGPWQAAGAVVILAGIAVARQGSIRRRRQPSSTEV
jgi:drug/metabolite transporter (DMT)-like permease